MLKFLNVNTQVILIKKIITHKLKNNLFEICAQYFYNNQLTKFREDSEFYYNLLNIIFLNISFWRPSRNTTEAIEPTKWY